jgi:phosphoribosyl 1,2-cyclic phosphate phosphodiesterase
MGRPHSIVELSWPMDQLSITFLGTGTSNGIPVIGCDCPVCTSGNFKNKRTRSSILLSTDYTNVLIDISPDFRSQALRAEITDIDAVFLTHAHADHLHGLDDIRPLSWGKVIPVYGNEPALAELVVRFDYIFRSTQKGGGKPRVSLHDIENSPVKIGDIRLVPIPIKHGNLDILGYRIGNISYLTDCSFIPEESYRLLAGTEILIIGSLRYNRHPTHFSVSEAVTEIEKIGPRKAYLTHICHEAEHEELLSFLPDSVEPGWDGLKIEVVVQPTP